MRPSQLGHPDFVHRHRQPVVVLARIDEVSRFVPGRAMDDAERADAVIGAIEAARRWFEAEKRQKHLSRMNPKAWPGAPRAGILRQQPVRVPDGGGPVFEGRRVGIPSAWNADRVEFVEFGRATRDGRNAQRAAGEAAWKLLKSDDGRMTSLKPDHDGADWPLDEEGVTVRSSTLRRPGRPRCARQHLTVLLPLAHDLVLDRSAGGRSRARVSTSDRGRE